MLLLWFCLLACQPAAEEHYVPEHFPAPTAELEPDVVELGRWLFYDQQLSINGTRSCGVCHEQAKAFTDGLVRAVGATNEAQGDSPVWRMLAGARASAGRIIS